MECRNPDPVHDVAYRGHPPPQKRRAELVWANFGALQLMETPGVRLSLNHDTIAHWNAVSPGGSSIAQELLPPPGVRLDSETTTMRRGCIRG